MSRHITVEYSRDSSRYDDLSRLFTSQGLGLRERAWLEWKYADNPDGPPIIAAALNEEGELVGHQAYLPRVFESDSSTLNTVQAVDAVVHADYRRMGIYQRIWTETKKMLSDNNLTLMTFPSTDGMSIGAMRKEGLTELGDMQQMCLILKPGTVFAQKMLRGHGRGSLLARTVDAVARLLLAPSRSTIQTVPIKRFEHDYAVHDGRMHGRRSKEYLNWRFVDNPMVNFESFLFQDSGKTIGYCCFCLCGNIPSAYIYDFYADYGRERCIRSIVSFIASKYKHVNCVFYKMLSNFEVGKCFIKCGFFPLKVDNVMFVGNVRSDSPLAIKKNWHLTIGDTDW